MKYNLLILTFIILTSLIVTQLSNNNSNLKEQQILKKIDNFQFKNLEAKTISTHDFMSNIVIIHFWATWCPPCIKEIPEIIKFAKNNPHITILTFAVNNESDDIKKFLMQYKVKDYKNLVIGLDPDSTISEDLFETLKLPETFIMTRHFTIYEKIKGINNNWNDKQWLFRLKNNAP